MSTMFVAIPDPASPGPDRESRVLAELEGLKLVALTLRRGVPLADHVAPGPITLQLVAGRATLTAGDQTQPLAPGQVALIAAGVRHALQPEGHAPVLVLLHRASAPGGAR